MEIAAALENGLPVVFACVAVGHLQASAATLNRGGNGAVYMLYNFSRMVDVTQAECTVAADKTIYASINPFEVKKRVRQELTAAMVVVEAEVSGLDAYRCGDLEVLDEMTSRCVQGRKRCGLDCLGARAHAQSSSFKR